MDKPSLRKLNFDLVLRSAPGGIANRGTSYYFQQKVQILGASDEEAVFRVTGSSLNTYDVHLQLHPDSPDRFIKMKCTCPFAASGENGLWCKHKYAALLAIKEHFRLNKPTDWRHALSSVLMQGSRQQAAAARPQVLVYGLVKSYKSYQWIPFLVSADNMDPDSITSRDALVRQIMQTARFNRIQRVTQKNVEGNILNADHRMISIAKLLSETWRYGFTADNNFDRTTGMISDAPMFLASEMGDLKYPLSISPEVARYVLEIDDSDDALKLRCLVRLGEEEIPVKQTVEVGSRPKWLMCKDLIFKVDCADEVDSFARRYSELTIPAEEKEAFFNDYLPGLSSQFDVSPDSTLKIVEVIEEPSPRIYLLERDGRLYVQFRVSYGDVEWTYGGDNGGSEIIWRDGSLLKITRDIGFEQEMWQSLSSFGLKRGVRQGEMELRSNVTAIDFLFNKIPALVDAGFEVFGQENISSVRVNKNRPKISLQVSSGVDWFDLNAVVQFGDIGVSLADFRRAVRRKERFIKLADGSVGMIPDDIIHRFQRILGMGKMEGDSLRFSKTQAALLEAAAHSADESEFDEDFRVFSTRLRDFQRIEPVALPEGFTGELRNYQRAGFDWLHFLREYGFGGCLADDMGTGKTVQALCFLQSLKERAGGRLRALIVAPKSIITNWIREAERFTPGLKFLSHTEMDRAKSASAFEKCDVVLTTYGILLRDIKMLSAREFECVILDESQAIKNPDSQTARAARLLKSRIKLTLTGTPVENSAMELWSQFAFALPGLLGPQDNFRQGFALPIEKRNDSESSEILRNLIKPFLLRRTKEQVATELPPRTEGIVYCDMGKEQKKVYETVRDRYRAELLGVIDGSGLSSARMQILEGLLRLRQICNHPVLVEAGYKGQSAKIEVLLEMLETLNAEGNKALVFSQFVQMLNLIRPELDSRGIKYAYLDGSSRDRQQQVDLFQNDPGVPFFLISLKAGGQGLNLTAAGYVVHVDPWWNPAVERQASDRAHRIGQDKPVFIDKLIVRGTVEEKILDLQDRKKKLVNQLITSEASFFKNLTAEDVKQLFS